MHKRVIRAPRGSTRTCKTWAAEAAFRMLQNNVDPEVAENPDDLVVYGGLGKAARNWECFDAILGALQRLEPDETLLIQSGKPVGILPTHIDAPRVIIANSNLVPKWATWENFRELDKKGLMMFGQMTAGSWIYIGTQGILQGTYETFAACGRKHFGESGKPLAGRVVVSAGLGGMGGAQPLAATLAGAAFLGIEVDASRAQRRFNEGYLNVLADSLEQAVDLVRKCASHKESLSVGVIGNVGDVLPKLLQADIRVDVLTDQTSAHDPLVGYIPSGLSISEAASLRESMPTEYIRLVQESAAAHVETMLQFQARGTIVFDYGNNLRDLAAKGGATASCKIPGFVPEYIRPMFCEGYGPFRWVALSGDPRDIAETDQCILESFPKNATVTNWIRNGAPKVKFQGLPSRICWLKHGDREKAGVAFNTLVRTGRVSAPIVIGRDHLDCGSVASPNRETEAMLDGSDAVSDWPLLNFALNAVNGASWVSFHHGGGVGMGLSQHAGMVIVADGTDQAERKLRRVLNGDPALGILRHADAGYEVAQSTAVTQGIQAPMLTHLHANKES